MNSGVHDHRDSRVQGLLNELEDDQTAMRRERGDGETGKGRDGGKGYRSIKKQCRTVLERVLRFNKASSHFSQVKIH